MSRQDENTTMISNLSKNFEGTAEEGRLFLLGNIAAILIDISKSLAIIADEKQDHKKSDDNETQDYYTSVCSSCGKPGPIGDFCIWCGEKGTCI